MSFLLVVLHAYLQCITICGMKYHILTSSLKPLHRLSSNCVWMFLRLLFHVRDFCCVFVREKVGSIKIHRGRFHMRVFSLAKTRAKKSLSKTAIFSAHNVCMLPGTGWMIDIYV